jgi:hypothetical protein
VTSRFRQASCARPPESGGRSKSTCRHTSAWWGRAAPVGCTWEGGECGKLPSGVRGKEENVASSRRAARSCGRSRRGILPRWWTPWSPGLVEDELAHRAGHGGEGSCQGARRLSARQRRRCARRIYRLPPPTRHGAGGLASRWNFLALAPSAEPEVRCAPQDARTEGPSIPLFNVKFAGRDLKAEHAPVPRQNCRAELPRNDAQAEVHDARPDW